MIMLMEKFFFFFLFPPQGMMTIWQLQVQNSQVKHYSAILKISYFSGLQKPLQIAVYCLHGGRKHLGLAGETRIDEKNGLPAAPQIPP